jgi:acetylornithine/N-succinyldiaminopimelate aminotransferase
MGALLAREGIEFRKGEHGSTFAGGPLACAAARSTISVIEKVLPDVPQKGKRFADQLSAYNPRARGLMIGITIGDACPAVQKKCAEDGVLVNCAADGNLRLVPPLVITNDEIDRAASVVNAAMAGIRR